MIKFLFIQLHQLWIQHYSIVHAKVSDKTIFKELEELREEVQKIRFTLEYQSMTENEAILSIDNITLLSVARIKEWLFNYYLVLGDY